MTEEDDQRAIDLAMAAGYPSKQYIRAAWLDEIRYRRRSILGRERVLYLTLCGRHAVDIQMLIDDGILRLLENGAIDDAASARVVAFESNSPAATAVKRNFIGLDVMALNIENELKVQSPLNFPDNKMREKFCAAVQNLDFDKSANIIDGAIAPIRLIRKISQIQQVKKEPWSLCLTLNATLNWSPEDQRLEQTFLLEQLARCESAEIWLREQAEDAETSLTEDLRGEVSVEALQAFHLLCTTARLAEALASQGWELIVQRSFAYGNQEGRAPMVSWILRLEYSADAERRRSELVVNALEGLVRTVEKISPLDDPPS